MTGPRPLPSTPPPEVPEEFVAAYRAAYQEAYERAGSPGNDGLAPTRAPQQRNPWRAPTGLLVIALLVIACAFLAGRASLGDQFVKPPLAANAVTDFDGETGLASGEGSDNGDSPVEAEATIAGPASGDSAVPDDAAQTRPSRRSTRITDFDAKATCVLDLEVNDNSGGKVLPDQQSFGPDYAVDQRPETAWICPGRGGNAVLSLELPGPVVINRLGIIPGYARTDESGVSWFAKSNRISELRWTIGDQQISQQIPDRFAHDWIQPMEISPTEASSIQLHVVSTHPGVVNWTAISEVLVMGVAAE